MEHSFKAKTGSSEKFKIESELVYATWLTDAVCANGNAPIEVGFRMVGFGAPVECICRTEKGKKLGILKGTAKANRFVSEIPITEKVPFGETAYFEVKLPKHGISMESNRVRTFPEVVVTSMKWDRKEVWHNDTVGITVDFDELPDYTPAKITMYEYKESGAHIPFAEINTTVNKSKISLQWKFCYNKDTSAIPDNKEMQKIGKQYEPVKLFFDLYIYGQVRGNKQESGFLLFKDVVYLTVYGDYGLPVKNTKCKILLPDGTERNETTNSEGAIALRNLPPGKLKIKVNTGTKAT